MWDFYSPLWRLSNEIVIARGAADWQVMSPGGTLYS